MPWTQTVYVTAGQTTTIDAQLVEEGGGGFVVQGDVTWHDQRPMTDCYVLLFEEDGGTLRLSATDLEISIVQKIDVAVEVDGPSRVAVPAKRLIDTLRALPNVPVRFSADTDFNVVLDTDKGHYKMVGHDGADYPALPTQQIKQETNEYF